MAVAGSLVNCLLVTCYSNKLVTHVMLCVNASLLVHEPFVYSLNYLGKSPTPSATNFTPLSCSSEL